MLTKKDLLKLLNSSQIKYKIYDHDPLFTVKDSAQKRGIIKGAHSKNLFLKNKKNQYFLFSCLENTVVELKKISKSLSLGNLSFANEHSLQKYLGVNPGSVTPFGLLNDEENIIKFFFDYKFLKYEIVNFHPLINTSTIGLSVNRFIDFFLENKKKVNIFDFINNSLIE